MTTPIWLTEQQIRLVQILGGFKFAWKIRNEPPGSASVVHGQWTRNPAEEINLALRAAPDESFVGVDPPGHGLWHDSRKPAMGDAVTATTGALGEMLDLAMTWAKDREPAR